MKSFTIQTTLVLIFLFFQQSIFAQCIIAVGLSEEPGICIEDVHTYTGMLTGNCNDAAYYEYTYTAYNDDLSFEIMSQSDTIPTLWSPSEFILPVNLLASYVTFKVDAYDIDNNILATDSIVSEYISSDESWMFYLEDMLEFTCGNGCFSVDYNWNFFWDYAVDGIFIYPQYESYCFDSVGTYTVSAQSFNGCTQSVEVTVDDITEDENAICINATPLENGVLFEDQVCSSNEFLSECNTLLNYGPNYFTFNSDTLDHLVLGIQLDNYFTYNVSIYEMIDGCDSLQSIYCSYLNEVSTCYSIYDDVLLNENTDYLIEFTAAPGTPFSIAISLSDNELSGICGCTNPESCLYDENAIISTYCGYLGCTDIGACNYQQYADCDNGSCTYGENLAGQLFQDLNGDGFWQQGGFFPEPSLGNTGTLYIEELELTIYPNNEGEFALPEIPLGEYSITYTDENNIWTVSSDSTFTMTLPTCYGANIGLIPTDETMLQVSGPCCIWMMDIHCQNGFNPGLWIQNLGTTPLNGTFTMTFDSLLVPAELSSAVPWDTYAGGVLVWNIVDQAPGTAVLYQCHIVGPGTDYIGQIFPFIMDLELLNTDDSVFYTDSWTLEPTVTCAYDPNDKYAVPEGYTDNHFILEEDEIEYRIRFQNTGNAPAETVKVVDQLDADQLDLSTFEPVFASHSFSTSIDGTGKVEFLFDNIMLPDSASDEPGSQGYVVFRIKPLAGLDMGAEINNTAEIYFDLNPPIITNTTWHTIYACSSIVGLEETIESCEVESQVIDLTQEYVEGFDWSIENSPLNINSPSIAVQPEYGPGTYDVQVVISNPLCAVTSEATFTIFENPEAEIILIDGLLTTSSGEEYQWYLNGEIIDGATDESYTPMEEGFYAVEITNTNGCSSLSADYFASNIDQTIFENIVIYPNPAVNELNVQLPIMVDEIVISNALGQTIKRFGKISGNQQLDISDLEPGVYQISMKTGDVFWAHSFVKQ